MTESKELTIEQQKEKMVQNIVANYKSVEQSIVSQLELYYAFHGGMSGRSRENIWCQLFEMIVPKKFVIEHSVFIIDSQGDISKEVDLAIIDNMYTPYIFQYGEVKFVPIEAVAAVIECKSTDAGNSARKNKDGKKADSSPLEEWYKSIEALQTSNESIARMALGTVIHGVSYSDGKSRTKSTQTSTRPIRIFCGHKTTVDVKKLLNLFDFVLIAGKGENPGIQVYSHGRTLKQWYESLDHHKGKVENCEEKHRDASKDETEIRCGKEEDGKNQIKLEPVECEELTQYKLEDYQVEDAKGESVSLLSFNFQLNQLLMIINNPILFPHRAYAELFNRGPKVAAADQETDSGKEGTGMQDNKAGQSKKDKKTGKTEKDKKTRQSKKVKKTGKTEKVKKQKGGNDGGEDD